MGSAPPTQTTLALSSAARLRVSRLRGISTRGQARLRSSQACTPALLDPAIAPDEDRRRPGEHEHTDDDEPGGVHVEVVDETPEAVVPAQAVHLGGHETQHLHRAD